MCYLSPITTIKLSGIAGDNFARGGVSFHHGPLRRFLVHAGTAGRVCGQGFHQNRGLQRIDLLYELTELNHNSISFSVCIQHEVIGNLSFCNLVNLLSSWLD